MYQIVSFWELFKDLCFIRNQEKVWVQAGNIQKDMNPLDILWQKGISDFVCYVSFAQIINKPKLWILNPLTVPCEIHKQLPVLQLEKISSTNISLVYIISWGDAIKVKCT